MSKSIIRLQAVSKKTGRGRSTIYADIAKGNFPPPIKIGERASGWVEDEIDQWINDRIDASRNDEAA